MARALLAEDRQDGLGDVEDAEQVRLELVAELLLGDLLDGAEEAVAGVVDDDVERSERLVRGLHGGGDLVAVGDVELEGSTASPYCSTRSFRVSVLRAVAATLSPRWSAASTNSRPKPFEAPVTNQTLLMVLLRSMASQ